MGHLHGIASSAPVEKVSSTTGVEYMRTAVSETPNACLTAASDTTLRIWEAEGSTAAAIERNRRDPTERCAA